MKVNVKLEITEDELRSVLVSAVEGGIAYWAEGKPDTYDPDAGTITVREKDIGGHPRELTPGPWRKVSLHTIARGMQRCAKAAADEGGWAFTTWLKDRTGDAQTADNIFQFGLLNELKYG